jgi:hypothetical protein
MDTKTILEYAEIMNADGGEGSGVKGHTTEKPGSVGAARSGVSSLWQHALNLRDKIDKALGESHPASVAHGETLKHLESSGPGIFSQM